MGSALELTASRLSLAPSLPSAHRMACDQAVQHRHAAPACGTGLRQRRVARVLCAGIARVRNVHVRCQARAGHAHGGLCGARERVSIHLRSRLQMPYASLERRVEVKTGGRSEKVYDGALAVGRHSPSA